MAPIGFILASFASFTSEFTNVLDSSTSKFANILESIACNLITVFVIFFHAIISHDHRFFFGVPRIEEVQDPDSSPRREEVGRRPSQGRFLKKKQWSYKLLVDVNKTLL